MLYSVRMRAAQGASHEEGGRHISGAERLVTADQLPSITAAMMERALSHSRGRADFIHITVETIGKKQVKEVPLLPVSTFEVPDFGTGREKALAQLGAAGIEPEAAKQGMEQLLALPDSMRGAMLVCAKTGRRLDHSGQRGIRVSRMDIRDALRYQSLLTELGLGNTHAREAMVLAAKVASAPGVAAELCWSDDPEYVTGYVASAQGYVRITKLKPFGSPIGGRIFFVDPGTDLEALEQYLRYQTVWVDPSARKDE
jgi:6-carboxyhexanoate--CoA ligase